MVFYMQYDKISGFSDEISPEIDIQFSVLKKLGISYFEPRGVDGDNISTLSDAQVLKLREKMDIAGIKASSVGSPVGKIKVNEDFEPHFEMYKRVVRTAKMLNCRFIRMFSFYNENEIWTDEDRDEVYRRLSLLIAYAEDHDVVLLHENEKDIYGDTVEKCLALMEHFACEHFGCVFDPANFVQCGIDTKEAYAALSPYIRYVHIKDAHSEDRKVVPAGKGDGNIPYILEKLFQSGYDGFISLEPHLGNFQGLADLEMDDLMSDLPDGGEGTFSLAYQSLCTILEAL